ncbi:hypothetical protein FJ250_08010, partial [bacterium]|nr:hypothetical protein [bacterium]
MRSRQRHLPAIGLALLGVLLVEPRPVPASPEAAPAHQEPGTPPPDSLLAPAEAPESAADDRDPWTRWFDALEQSADLVGPHLYPLDGPAEPPAARPYRHLAIAKAVTELERARDEAGGAGKSRAGDHHEDARGAADSPLLALANARNYLHLSEYDLALDWYARTGALDRDGHFRRETGREALAAAICARDTVAAGKALANVMTASDLAGREAEFVLAMRWLLGRKDATTLSWFVDRAAAPEFAADVRVGFWRAYSLSWLERRGEALSELDRLLALGGRESVLGARERGWVLTAWTDLTLLGGDRLEAER